MERPYAIEAKLEKKLTQLYHKDKIRYNYIIKKIHEITTTENISHYKNLKKPLQHLKRVHVGSYVLTFQYIQTQNSIIFHDLTHHDEAY